jgi:outer membrane protein OmpA-like peptidoglycan-associated protein/tetratricopeptide (TPR) repeat protein
MSRLYIYILCMLITLPALGQRTEQRIAVGDDFYNKGQYLNAIDVYERILRRERTVEVRQELSFKMGESYRSLLNYQEAKKWYIIALNLGYEEPIIYLHLSEMTLGLEEFDNSIDFINRYLEFDPTDARALKLHQSAQFAKENYSTETIFEVSNESALNTPGQQWGVAFLENFPIFYADQARVDQQFDIDIRLRYNNIFYWAWVTRTLKDRVVFSSTQPVDGSSTNGYSNIYQATFNKRAGDWDNPRLLDGAINSSYYDGFLSYDAANEIAYFMNSGGQDGSRATSDIYISEHNTQTDTWGQPRMFAFNDQQYNIGYPSINEEGNILYFASDMPGGYGGYDIYKILKDENGEWGEPINLGPTINTAFNDSYPYIAGDVLYFSSYGHPGFGGFDVFYSIIDEKGEYSEPLNMGVPVNSSADDFGFIIDESYSRGFFSSNRPGGKGEDDLYSFRVISKTFTVQGRVVDYVTGAPVAGLEIFFFDDNNNFYDVVTDINGFYDLPDLSTDVNYYVTAYPENYQELADTIAVRDQLLANRFEVITNYEKNFALIPVDFRPTTEEPVLADVPVVDEIIATPAEPEVEDTIIDELTRVNDRLQTTRDQFALSADGLPVLYFDFGKSNLRPYSVHQLDSVVKFLQANPDKGLVINAHTDEISGYLFNFYLSQQRAQSISNYLRRQGIDINRLYPQGHGKMQLAIRGATTDHEHQLNRRANFESIPVSQLQAYLEDASRHSFRYLNSIQKEAHFADGIEFMVQFMASAVPINPQYYRKIIDNVPEVDIIYYYDNDRFHRYLAGSFRDFESAFALQRVLRQLGYEIYVVAFNNGERIPVSQARRLTGEL